MKNRSILPAIALEIKASRKQLFKSMAHCKAAGAHVTSPKTLRQKARQSLKAELAAD